MRAYVITLEGNEYSERSAWRCIESADLQAAVEVEKFWALDSETGPALMRGWGMRWTWAKGNAAADVCEITGLKQRPYGQLAAKIGCSMSHFMLWRRCVQLDEPILILEHDAEFIGPLPDIRVTCQINDPEGATPHGAKWSAFMRSRGPGIWPKTRVMPDKAIPDGLAGNSAYVITPADAAKAVRLFETVGVWPNDATLCLQLFPDLKELYPFVTRVKQTESTTGA